MSESINGYKLVKPFTNAGGGQSRWTFARQGTTEYFIKEFLSPTFPVPGAPGSAETKRKKLERCELFEAHHNEMTAALADLSARGGNLVVTRSFFRNDTKYYRVTDKVDISSLPTAGIAALNRDKQIAIAIAVTHSVGVLHRSGIVHGDLKPPNVLINDLPPRGYSTKLIDFDNAFYAGRPPLAEDLVGDPAYYSPELLQYINGDGLGGQVGLASDIFALGILFLSYFGAEIVPATGAGGRPLYPAEQVMEEGSIDSGLGTTWPKAHELLATMTDVDPGRRPTATAVHGALKKLLADPDATTTTTTTRVPRVAPAVKESTPWTGGSRLTGRGRGKTTDTERPPVHPVPDPPAVTATGEKVSRLKGRGKIKPADGAAASSAPPVADPPPAGSGSRLRGLLRRTEPPAEPAVEAPVAEDDPPTEDPR